MSVMDKVRTLIQEAEDFTSAEKDKFVAWFQTEEKKVADAIAKLKAHGYTVTPPPQS